ncbi:MAG: radical SAM protein [Candidatus Bathyarchaeota archaeon]
MLNLEKSPKRVVRHYLWSPSLILRQALSALYVGALSRWQELPRWFLSYGLKCLPGAAGSKGMGCIGFPAHPVWEMTTACNLNCIHCHASGGKPTPNELTTEEAKCMLNQLARIKEFRMMAFTGGEPLLRNDLFELLDYSKALGFTNTMATNATLIDYSVAKNLQHSGVVIAAVSLDGFDAETHDMIRDSPGAFDSAIRGMRALRRAGILLHVNITAMEYNVNQMRQLMTIIEELGASILLMYQLVPVGRGQGISQATLDLDSNEQLIRFIVQAQRLSRAIIEPVAAPQYWPFLLKRNGIVTGPLLRLAETVFHGCSAGRGFVYIKPDGEVWPCPFLELNCGNIREMPFRVIWANSPILKDLRQREQRLKGRCGECQYRRLCGGCRGRAWTTTGDYLAEDPSCFIHSLNRNEDQPSTTSL